jgi:hypothetical protein
VQERSTKRSTFTLANGWQHISSKREALLTSVNARLPPTHRKWRDQASTQAQA